MSKSTTLRERILMAAADRFRRSKVSVPVAQRMALVRAAQEQLQRLRDSKDKGASLKRMKLRAIVDTLKAS